MYPSRKAHTADAPLQEFVKKAGELVIPGMFVVGNVYGIPSYAVGHKDNVVYQCTYRTNDGHSYTFDREVSGMPFIITRGQLQRADIELLVDNSSTQTQSASFKVLNDPNVKFDKDPLPEGFLVEGEKYSVASQYHADDKKRTDFRTKNYVYLGRNKEPGKYQGGYVFGLAHAWNKTIVFSHEEITGMRLERVVEIPKHARPADSENIDAVVIQMPAQVAQVAQVAQLAQAAHVGAPAVVPEAVAVVAVENDGVAAEPEASAAAPEASAVAPERAAEKAADKIPYFMPNKYGDDMDAPLSEATKLYHRAKPFLQEDKTDATYALLDALMGQITNKTALMLIVISQQSETRKSNVSRTLKVPTYGGAKSLAEREFIGIINKLDISEASPHYDILKYGMEFFDFDPAVIMASAKAQAPQKPSVEAAPEQQESVELETDISMLAELLLETMDVPAMMRRMSSRMSPLAKDKKAMADAYIEHKALVQMAVKVLDPKEFSMLAFYMRPLVMRPPQDSSRWVDLPDAIDAYRKTLKLPERQEIAYLAAMKIKISDDYKEHSQKGNRNSDKSVACHLLRGIMDGLSVKVSPNTIAAGRTMEKEARPAVSTRKGEAKAALASVAAAPAPAEPTGTAAILQDVIATLPTRDGQIINKAYAEALKIAAQVLDVEEFSILSFYLRPKKMFVPPRGAQTEDTRVAMPVSTHPYREGKEISDVHKICEKALATIIASDVFTAAQQSDKTPEIKKAADVIQALASYIDGKINPKVAAAPAPAPVTAPVAKATKSAASAKAVKAPVAAPAPVEPPAEPPVASPAVAAVAASAYTVSFNTVAGVLEEERKNIQRFSPQEGLLGYFAEVAGLGAKSLALISMTLLRKDKLKPQEAAEKLGLDFEDASAMVEGAIAKIKTKAAAGNDNFITDQLKHYKFVRT